MSKSKKNNSASPDEKASDVSAKDLQQRPAGPHKQTLSDSLIETSQDPAVRSFRWYLLFPVLIFSLAFVLDKQLFIWRFPDYYLRTASYISYEHKIQLMDEMELYLRIPPDQRKKVLVMFGNSRTTSFNNAYIDANHPDWILYNFSVPGGTADYFCYMLEEFQERNLRPDFVFFAVTPQGMNATPSIAMDEVMLNGLSTGFILRNFTRYNVSDVSNYAAKELFWTYQYRPKLKVILERWKNHSEGARELRYFNAITQYNLLQNRGSVPYGDGNAPEQNPDFLRKTAEGTWRDFLSPFKINPGQVYFNEHMVELANELQIPNALLWVKVGPFLRELKANRRINDPDAVEAVTIRDVFVPIMKDIESRHDTRFVDMNYTDGIQCDRFYDSSHMAAYCFPEFTDFLFAHIRSRADDL